MKSIAPAVRLTAIALAACLALAAAGSALATDDPLEADDFVARVDNPWLPFRPGSTLVYRGTEDGEPARDVVAVRARAETVAGVRCTVVSDFLYLSGRLRERTTDWYAQDEDGNVWYFGEETAELDTEGRVTSREGSWRAGVAGARPGIVMPARPRVGQRFQQERYPGHAEDRFQVLSLSATVRAPAVTSHHALLTKEWTPLQPRVVDHKLYVRGVGLVRDVAVRGASDRLELVRRS